MNSAELEAAIEQANRIFSHRYRPGKGLPQEPGPQLTPSYRASRETWPPASRDAERRFGQPHAKLFPFLGRKVWTTAGTGTLLQVFAERVTVLLDSEVGRCSFFPPAEIEPVSWELP